MNSSSIFSRLAGWLIATVLGLVVIVLWLTQDPSATRYDWITTIGTFVGCLALTFSFIQLGTLTRRAELIETTVRRTETGLRRFISADEIVHCRRLAQEAVLYIRTKQFDAGYVRLQDFCDALTRLRQTPTLFSPEELDVLDTVLKAGRHLATQLELHLQSKTKNTFSAEKVSQFIAPSIPILESVRARLPYDQKPTT